MFFSYLVFLAVFSSTKISLYRVDAVLLTEICMFGSTSQSWQSHLNPQSCQRPCCMCVWGEGVSRKIICGLLIRRSIQRHSKLNHCQGCSVSLFCWPCHLHKFHYLIFRKLERGIWFFWLMPSGIDCPPHLLPSHPLLSAALHQWLVKE